MESKNLMLLCWAKRWTINRETFLNLNLLTISNRWKLTYYLLTIFWIAIPRRSGLNFVKSEAIFETRQFIIESNTSRMNFSGTVYRSHYHIYRTIFYDAPRHTKLCGCTLYVFVGDDEHYLLTDEWICRIIYKTLLFVWILRIILIESPTLCYS